MKLLQDPSFRTFLWRCVLGALVVIPLVIVLAGGYLGWFRTTPGPPQRQPVSAPTPVPPAELTFEDPAVEAAVRLAAGIATGPIPGTAESQVTCLNIQSEDVYSLRGIEHLTHLEALGLASRFYLREHKGCGVYNTLVPNSRGALNLTPLAGLPALRELDLTGRRMLTGMQALDGLPKLEVLQLWSCQSGDPTWLTSLPRLRYLGLGSNDIEDLSALGDVYLPEIEFIELSRNQVRDFAPLTKLQGNHEPTTVGVSIGGNYSRRGYSISEGGGEGVDIVAELRASGLRVLAFPVVHKLHSSPWSDEEGLLLSK